MTKEEAWAAFAEQYNHRLHGPSDAFKFAWNAATKAEREACAKLVEADGLARGSDGLVLIKAAGRIRARGEQ